MEKKILVAVDNSVYSKYAVKYAARISSAAKNVTFTLFNVQPYVPQIFIESAETDPEVKALVRKNIEAAGCIVAKLKDLMVREGVPENRIETVTQSSQVGVAKDILN